MSQQAIVNLFEFSHGISITIGEEAYKLYNCNAEGILQMICNYNIDEIVLVGPKIITSKYERDIKMLNMSHFGNTQYKIICMED